MPKNWTLALDGLLHHLMCITRPTKLAGVVTETPTLNNPWKIGGIEEGPFSEKYSNVLGMVTIICFKINEKRSRSIFLSNLCAYTTKILSTLTLKSGTSSWCVNFTLQSGTEDVIKVWYENSMPLYCLLLFYTMKWIFHSWKGEYNQRWMQAKMSSCLYIARWQKNIVAAW